MSSRFVAALAFALLAAPASARPLPVDDLPGLARSVEAGLVLRLAERRGLDRQLDDADRQALASAGLSEEAIARLADFSAVGAEVDGVSYAVVDGVLRVRAEGEAGAGAEPAAESQAGIEPEPSANEVSEPSFDAAKAHLREGSQPEQEVLGSNPYPWGAMGMAGAVYVPARHGDRPSSFGSTIVTVAQPVMAGAWGPWPAPLIAPIAAPVAAPPRHFIPLRTSRGTLWVPN